MIWACCHQARSCSRNTMIGTSVLSSNTGSKQLIFTKHGCVLIKHDYALQKISISRSKKHNSCLKTCQKSHWIIQNMFIHYGEQNTLINFVKTCLNHIILILKFQTFKSTKNIQLFTQIHIRASIDPSNIINSLR